MSVSAGYHKISAEEYHADCCVVPSLSCTVAKVLLRESPRKAWHVHPRLNPAYSESHDGKFDLGEAAHGVLLENDKSKVVIVDAADWRTNAAKQARGDAYAAGKTPLLKRHWEAVMTMVGIADNFIKNSEIADFWQGGESEVTGVCHEKQTWLRCRFDRITENRRFIIDYKSTEDASPEGFSRQIIRMGYFLQEAFYRRVARNLGHTGARFVFLAQSVEPPHECSLHDCHPGLQEIGDAAIEHAIRLWRQCMTTKEWPSYGGRVHSAMPTSYLLAEHEMRMADD